VISCKIEESTTDQKKLDAAMDELLRDYRIASGILCKRFAGLLTSDFSLEENQEEAGHLADLEPLWSARVGDYVSVSEQLTVADLTNRKTEEANHNARALEEILAEFRAARAKLMARVANADAGLFVRAIPHPRLKTPMLLMDHLYFVAEHDDHHLARIWELL
jgi:hypothetical protein